MYLPVLSWALSCIEFWDFSLLFCKTLDSAGKEKSIQQIEMQYILLKVLDTNRILCCNNCKVFHTSVESSYQKLIWITFWIYVTKVLFIYKTHFWNHALKTRFSFSRSEFLSVLWFVEKHTSTTYIESVFLKRGFKSVFCR